MGFRYLSASPNSERITGVTCKAKQKDQIERRLAWSWMKSLKVDLTFQFLETPQHCRPRTQLHSPVVLTDTLGTVCLSGLFKEAREVWGLDEWHLCAPEGASPCRMEALLTETSNSEM